MIDKCTFPFWSKTLVDVSKSKLLSNKYKN